MKKALLYRRGALGDTLLTFPILEILKRKGYHITAVGNTDYYRIAKEVGWADSIHYEIPEDEFDLEINISIDGNIKPFPQSRIWLVDHYLTSLGLPREFSLELPVKASKESPFKGKVAIAPSSGSMKKVPDPKVFLEIERILRSKGMDILYIVGEADEWVINYFHPVYKIEDLLKFSADVKGACLYIGVDSGISHLVSYLGVRSFVIFGPTDPIIWRPIGKHVHIINKSLPCSPCFPDVCEERGCFEVNFLIKNLTEKVDKYYYGYS